MLAQLLRAQEERAAKFAQAMVELRSPDAALSADTIYHLTDLAGENLQTFQRVWAETPVERRRTLIARLVETAETNFDLDFSAIINPALNDADEEVRQAALEGVLEDAPRAVIETVVRLAENDPFSAVRAAAAKALGPFVLRGELGKLPEPLSARLQDVVWTLHNNLNEDLDVRRRALEALANCSRDGVEELIRDAYHADEQTMRVSAIFAMGRSCDEALWGRVVLSELTSDVAEMRFEAARAAGELELKAAVPRLIELAFEGDREIQEMAIWSLGEIGGSAAGQTLNELAALADETGDDDLAEAVAEAQGAATLAAGDDDDDDLMPLFDFSEYDGDLDDERMQIVSLDDEDEDDEDEDDDEDDEDED